MHENEEHTDIDLISIFSNIDIEGSEEEKHEQTDKSVATKRSKERHFERRIKSELALEQELPWHFERGATYHCISFGDVDALTYLRTVVKQQRVHYCLISSWCMAITDAEEIKKWLDAGYVHRVDFYLGEIFPKQYAAVYQFIKENCLRNGGRIAIFRNHSKVMAGFGEHFDFAIASSANINTNPRCENTTITVSGEVARFYKKFFDGIRSFNRDFDDWAPFNEV